MYLNFNQMGKSGSLHVHLTLFIPAPVIPLLLKTWDFNIKVLYPKVKHLTGFIKMLQDISSHSKKETQRFSVTLVNKIEMKY